MEDGLVKDQVSMSSFFGNYFDNSGFTLSNLHLTKIQQICLWLPGGNLA
jgi:hypothetical protein